MLHGRKTLQESIASKPKIQVLENPLSGPGIVSPFFDLNFQTASSPLYTEKTFSSIVNQPIILQGLDAEFCSYLAYTFNDTFSDPILREGTVTLYSPSFVKDGPNGPYSNCGGLTAAGEIIGGSPMQCSAAAAAVEAANGAASS